MNNETVALALAWIATTCWLICFWWMHRISARQNAVLTELREQGARIEELSRSEHNLIKEVHPTVESIKESVEQVAETVAEDARHPAPAKR